MELVLRSWLLATVLLGCYRPGDVTRCAVTCNPAGADDCPAGLACNMQGLCAESATASCSEPADAPSDQGDGPPQPFCYGSGTASVCFPAEPSGDVSLMAFSTDDCVPGEFRSVAGFPACVIAHDRIAVEMDVHIEGAFPLVLIGVSQIHIQANAELDVSSSRGSTPGAGAPFSGCPPFSDIAKVPEGGPGGTFGGKGGAGGANGPQAPAALAVAFHGGCAGGDGNANSLSGGRSGGAVLLIADSILIEGAVLANGEGGGGAPASNGAGGGGGGSGGYVGLDTQTLVIAGKVQAIGGGGGAGGQGSVQIILGENGHEASVVNASAPGGASEGDNGEGGAGGTFGNGEPGFAPTNLAGAGGGGGGCGVIQILQSSLLCPSNQCVPKPVN